MQYRSSKFLNLVLLSFLFYNKALRNKLWIILSLDGDVNLQEFRDSNIRESIVKNINHNNEIKLGLLDSPNINLNDSK